MQGLAFHLARRVARKPEASWPRVAVGVGTGLLAPVLVILLGLLGKVQVDRRVADGAA